MASIETLLGDGIRRSVGSRVGGSISGVGLRVGSPIRDVEALKASDALAGAAANTRWAAATAGARHMSNGQDSRQVLRVRHVLGQRAGIDGRTGAGEVARTAGVSDGDADAVRVDRARLVVARRHDDLRARVRTADAIEAALRFGSAAVRTASGAADGQRLASPARRAAVAADGCIKRHSRAVGSRVLVADGASRLAVPRPALAVAVRRAAGVRVRRVAALIPIRRTCASRRRQVGGALLQAAIATTRVPARIAILRAAVQAQAASELTLSSSRNAVGRPRGSAAGGARNERHESDCAADEGGAMAHGVRLSRLRARGRAPLLPENLRTDCAVPCRTLIRQSAKEAA